MTKETGDAPGLPRLCWGAASHIGKVREENEDCYRAGPEWGVFVVSDGMGGHRGGAEASKIVTDVLPAMIKDRLKRLRSRRAAALRGLLKETIPDLNAHLHTVGRSETGVKGMGATVVIVLFTGDRACVANVGDSRAYRLRGRRLSQLTEDHSVVASLVREGHLEPQDTEDHPDQGLLTHHIGMEEDIHVHVRTLRVKPGDRFLLCTDGLTDVIDDQQIAAILRRHRDPQAACDGLVETANAAGGPDNVTALVVDWPGDPGR